MLPFIRVLTVFTLFVVAVHASAKDDPAPAQKLEPCITPANASEVRPIGAISRDAWRIIWWPERGCVALLGWETPVEVFDATSLKPVEQIAKDRKLVAFAVAADGNTVAWSENSTQVKMMELQADKSLLLQVGNHQPSLSFSPDGKLLATGGYGTEAKLWDTASGRLVRSLNAGPAEGALTPVFSPDGTLVAIGHRNSETRVYEVATGKLLHTLARKMSQELKFSPKGRVLAVAYVDGSVGLWDTTDGRLLCERASGAKAIYTLDWSPAGDLLATAGLRGKLTLWDPRDLTVLKELEVPEWVIQVRFSPDGTRLLSAGGSVQRSPDRKVVIWGVPAGK